MTFCSNNSRPVVFNGLPKDRCDELLGNLLTCIYENFRACDRPENYLERVDVGNLISETRNTKIVLVVGASNMKHCAKSLEDCGVPTDQITIPGWMCSPENVTKMLGEMETKSLDAGAFVFDLLSNSTLRFENSMGHCPCHSKATENSITVERFCLPQMTSLKNSWSRFCLF